MILSDHSCINKPGLRVLLVAGGTPPNCARLPEVLAGAGITVSALAHPENLVLASRHVQHRVIGSAKLDVTLDILRKMMTTQPDAYDWVILGDEEIVGAVGDCRAEPWAAQCFPVPLN